MNRLGRFLSFQICGESHGHGVGAILDGIPSGLPVSVERVQEKLDRRRPGQNRHTTKRNEADAIQIKSGVFHDKTTGAPILLWIDNKDTKSKHYDNIRRIPRPGHADWTGHVKFDGFQDPRGGGHFSGRLTAPLVAAGALAQEVLAHHQISVSAHLNQVGALSGPVNTVDVGTMAERVKTSSIQTAHADLEESFVQHIDEARTDHGNSIGGAIEFRAEGLPVGLGEPWAMSVESHLSQYLFSIPAIKGVSFGAGFDAVKMRGSEHNDAYRMEDGVVRVQSNHAGGVLGGITTGAPLWGSVAVKPTSSIFHAQDSVDIVSQENTTLEIKGRHDPIIAVRAVPVVEAAIALGLADLLLCFFSAHGTKSPWLGDEKP